MASASKQSVGRLSFVFGPYNTLTSIAVGDEWRAGKHYPDAQTEYWPGGLGLVVDLLPDHRMLVRRWVPRRVEWTHQVYVVRPEWGKPTRLGRNG
jgi:hypothetical protein